MLSDKTKTIATAHSADAVRLMRAMGIQDEYVTAFSLAVATDQMVMVTVTRYLTEAELSALADELEASPLQGAKPIAPRAQYTPVNAD